MTLEPVFLTLIAGQVFAFAIGLAAWPGVEYLIHCTLSHKYRTFVTPLHMGHHKNPHGVLTAPHAWVPVSLAIWGLASLAFGVVWATPAALGLLVGFARYERFHWRIHFDTPRNAREELLFAHHLAHHYKDAKNYHGVTTRVMDHVFGTLPAHWKDDYARVAGRPPLVPKDTFAVYRPGGLRAMRERGRNVTEASTEARR
jgi:hypothetical protein